MKLPFHYAWWAVCLAGVLLTGGAARAQVPVAGSGTGVNVAFVKLFSPLTAFSAKVETQSIDAYQQVLVKMPMELAALDGKVRLDIDLAQVQSKDFSAATLATLKQSGLDRMVSLFRPDKKLNYIIYPGIQSYQEVAMTAGESEAYQKGLRLERTGQSKETVDGHPCTKSKSVVLNGTNAVLEATTWNAMDLSNFPVKIEMKEKGVTVRMRLSEAQFRKPDAKLFEVPAGYGRMK